MATIAKITTFNAHGRFTVNPVALDRAIKRYLPASVKELRQTVKEVCGWDPKLDTVSELLMALADAQGPQ